MDNTNATTAPARNYGQSAKAIEGLKRSLRNLQAIQRNIMCDDYESLDALARTINDLDSQIFELELLQQPATDELAVAWDARVEVEAA